MPNDRSLWMPPDDGRHSNYTTPIFKQDSRSEIEDCITEFIRSYGEPPEKCSKYIMYYLYTQGLVEEDKSTHLEGE